MTKFIKIKKTNQSTIKFLDADTEYNGIMGADMIAFFDCDGELFTMDESHPLYRQLIITEVN